MIKNHKLKMNKKGLAWNELSGWVLVLIILLIIIVIIAGVSDKFDIGILRKIGG